MQVYFARGGKKLLPFFLVFLLWYLAWSLQLWSEYVLPGPGKVLAAGLAMLDSGELWEAVCVSFRRVLLGFSAAFVLAFAMGVVGVLLPGLRLYYVAFVDFVRHIPPLSLIPLLILWTGIGELPKMLIILLATFGPMLLNIDAGLGGCDKKLLELGQVLGLDEGQLFWRIRVPYALPNIFVGLRAGLGYSLRAIIGAEMIAASSGLGYMILDAQTMSRTDKAIVGIIAIGLLGLIIDFALNLLMRRLFPYLQEE